MPKLSSVSGCSLLRRVARDRRGATAVIFALSSTALVGIAGVGIDLAVWQTNKRTMQGAADQAAFSAAMAAEDGADGTQQAKAIAGKMGYADGTGGVTVTVNHPPASGGYVSNAQAWEVIVAQPQPMWFTNLFMSSPPSASARSVALQGTSQLPVCVLALDPTNASAASFSGTSSTNLTCAMGVNSSNSSGLSLSGSASVTASDVLLVANGYSKSHNASLNTSDLKESQPAISDPYASASFTQPIACDYSGTAPTGYSVPSGTATLSPGVYCGGLTIGAGLNVTLTQGTYYIVGGVFSVSSTATVSGNGVTFVLTGNTLGQTTYATASIAGGATLSLTAPTHGSLQGLVFFQDRNAPQYVMGSNTNYNSISGGSNQKISGALYFPNQLLSYSGNASTNGPGQCTQLIARDLYFTGTSTVQIQCGGTGVTSVGQTTVMVE